MRAHEPAITDPQVACVGLMRQRSLPQRPGGCCHDADMAFTVIPTKVGVASLEAPVKSAIRTSDIRRRDRFDLINKMQGPAAARGRFSRTPRRENLKEIRRVRGDGNNTVWFTDRRIPNESVETRSICVMRITRSASTTAFAAAPMSVSVALKAREGLDDATETRTFDPPWWSSAATDGGAVAAI
jgi:hypothetical protein